MMIPPVSKITQVLLVALIPFTSLCIVTEGRPLVLASPLRTLTIPDDAPSPESAPRARFFHKFKAGAEAESRVRKEIAAEERRMRQEESAVDMEMEEAEDDDFFEGSRWAEMDAAKDESYQATKQKRITAAFDAGFDAAAAELDRRDVAAAQVAVPSPKANNKYQFVGVVRPQSKGGKNVTWYARKKDKAATWSVRVLHVDRAAILRDQFVRGKIDLYGKYVNKGIPAEVVATDDNDDADAVPTRNAPVIDAEYSIKERSWRTLWNFSPKALFTDRSGMYWRQRRLNPGVYTDGKKVYETSYHYGEGRNGMKPVSSDLEKYLEKHNFPKEALMEKLEGAGSPDLVLEY